MPLLSWDPEKFDVQVTEMNEQHKQLIELMNALYERDAQQAPKSEIRGLLGRLYDLSRKHFSAEEALLDGMGFPQRHTHKQVHAKLLADFAAHRQEFDAGAGRVNPKFFDFLKLWLTSHILHTDKKYGE